MVNSSRNDVKANLGRDCFRPAAAEFAPPPRGGRRARISLYRGDRAWHPKLTGGEKRMAAGQKRNTALVPGAYQALEQFKQEVASELGITNYQGYLGDVPSRINGAVGGHMVRRMIAAAEQSL